MNTDIWEGPLVCSGVCITCIHIHLSVNILVVHSDKYQLCYSSFGRIFPVAMTRNYML